MGKRQVVAEPDVTIPAHAPSINNTVSGRMGLSDSPIGQRDPAVLYRVKKRALVYKKIGPGPYTFAELEAHKQRPMLMLRRGEITRWKEGDPCSRPSTT